MAALTAVFNVSGAIGVDMAFCCLYDPLLGSLLVRVGGGVEKESS